MSWCAPKSEQNALFAFALIAIVGTGGPFCPTKTLLFTAGPEDESHGLFGRLTALP
jgi:hypothetical protein